MLRGWGGEEQQLRRLGARRGPYGLGELGKHVPRFALYRNCCKGIAPSGAEVHNSDWQICLSSPASKAEPRIDRERGAGDQKEVRRFKESPRSLHTGWCRVFSKENDVRFQDASTTPAARHLE